MRKSTIPHNALVVVGDGGRAIFLRNNGTVMNPQLAVENVFEHDNPPTREQGTDRPTRGPSGFHSARGNIEQSDRHTLNESRFASDIADKLYHLAHANRFSNLVIVAPPKILGALRQSMHKEVLERVKAEVPKEMARGTLPDIQRELNSWGGPAD